MKNYISLFIVAIALCGCGTLPPLVPGGPSRSRLEVWTKQVEHLQDQVNNMPLPWTGYIGSALGLTAMIMHFFRSKQNRANSHLAAGS